MSIVLQGSTSGSVTLQEPAVAGTTVLTLPAVTGTVLTDTSPKAGNVIQVVNATYATQVNSTSGSTWVDTGISATITPTSSSSKILVLVSANGLQKNNTLNGGTAVSLQLLRVSTVITNIGNDNSSTDSVSPRYNTTSASTSYLDSPSTTSSTTYKVQFNNARDAADTVTVQFNGARSTITLLEIAA